MPARTTTISSGTPMVRTFESGSPSSISFGGGTAISSRTMRGAGSGLAGRRKLIRIYLTSFWSIPATTGLAGTPSWRIKASCRDNVAPGAKREITTHGAGTG